MSTSERQYYTSSEDFSKAVTEKMMEKAPEYGVKSLNDILCAALIQGPIGVRLYMHEGENLFATRIDEHGFYFLEDPEQKFKPEK